jgi:hypothetical protein
MLYWWSPHGFLSRHPKPQIHHRARKMKFITSIELQQAYSGIPDGAAGDRTKRERPIGLRNWLTITATQHRRTPQLRIWNLCRV